MLAVSKPLLIEIGTEELPTNSVSVLGKALLDGICGGLKIRNLSFGKTHWYASPRRLAALIHDVEQVAPEKMTEVLGPPLEAARDQNGGWSKAAIGFAKKHGRSPEDLTEKDTEKGPRLAFCSTIQGISIEESLADIINESLDALPIEKKMRWGAKQISFARPVHWAVVMYGSSVFQEPILGVTPGNTTFGHPVHSPDPIPLSNPEEYEELLEAARVIADFEKRKSSIYIQIQAAAKDMNATAVVDEELLSEVTGLCEWPVVLSGNFSSKFLSLPNEALILAMKTHQKYFHLLNSEGELLPHFITICNIESKNPEEVIRGNERVIHPRLSDAAFFFASDMNSSLEFKTSSLSQIIFQHDLGTLLDKVNRIDRNARQIAKILGASESDASQSALLCKSDLVSQMVLEFPDMQGIAGRHYALNEGVSSSVALAIEQHYWPIYAGSKLPETEIGVCVAIADRIDTLVGIFGLGMHPTGSKDPFALRRASLSILRILIEKAYFLDLRELVDFAIDSFSDDLLDSGTSIAVLKYIIDRLPTYYDENNISVEIFRSVSALDIYCPFDIDLRVKAVALFSTLPISESLAVANKRVTNILSKVGESESLMEINEDLFSTEFEVRLAADLRLVKEACSDLILKKDYGAALEQLSMLDAPLADFFENVMVNSEDPTLRANRISLLKSVHEQFLKVADISQLAGK